MKNQFRHIISISDFSREDLFLILKVIERMDKQQSLQINRNMMRGKTLGILFDDDNSVKDKLEILKLAIHKLGGNIIERNIGSNQEPPSDIATHARLIAGFSDVVAVALKNDGSARLVADSVSRGVINLGDACGDPFTLLRDLYSIAKSRGGVNGNVNGLEKIKIAILGNLKYNKLIHSFVSVLSLFSPRIYFVSPEELQFPIDKLKELNSKRVVFTEHDNIEGVISNIDVIFSFGLQRNDFRDVSEYNASIKRFSINNNTLHGVKENLAIFGELPNSLFSRDVDNGLDKSKHSQYYMQSLSSLYTWEALLGLSSGMVQK